MALLERSKLYQDVWSRPCTKIAAELGISSSALKRICTEMDIPTPVAGYWTRVQCGKKVSKDPLPKAKKETRMTWDVDLENSKRQKTERVRKQKEEKEVAEMVEAKALPVITIAADLENLHPLVKATRTQLREEWSNKPWDQRNKERRHFDARVFKDSLDRALLFLDAFARGVEALGLKFRCGLDDADARKPRREYGYYQEQRPSPVCWVEASGEKVSFVLKEKRKRVMITDPDEKERLWGRSYEDVPAGVFEFSIDAGWGFGRTSTWKDGKIQRVESQLDQIIATVPLAGEFLKQQRQHWEEEERRRKQLEELRYRMDAIKRKEDAALEILLNHSTNHRRACDLRAFIESARELYLQDHGQTPAENSPAGLWFKWAEQRAETLDPLGEGFRPWNGQAFRQIPGLFPES
ncbi:MAG: hypothetical protein ABI600_05860 [Luteolibacter sp.]